MRVRALLRRNISYFLNQFVEIFDGSEYKLFIDKRK